MDNPMRDVIEMMKANAQREGKQQTSPVLKAAMEKHRLREKLDMARNSNTMTIKSLIDADLWSDKPTGDRIIAMYQDAQTLQEQIDQLLKEIQGEE